MLTEIALILNRNRLSPFISLISFAEWFNKLFPDAHLFTWIDFQFPTLILATLQHIFQVTMTPLN